MCLGDIPSSLIPRLSGTRLYSQVLKAKLGRMCAGNHGLAPLLEAGAVLDSTVQTLTIDTSTGLCYGELTWNPYPLLLKDEGINGYQVVWNIDERTEPCHCFIPAIKR